MLKTNSKKATENIKNYIVNHFDFTNYNDGTTEEPQGFNNVAKFILATFRDEFYHSENAKRYYHYSEALAFADWAAGLPSVLDTCYYYNRSAVDDLAEILEETETEKAKYTESEAEKFLTSLIYRTLLKARW